MMRRGRNINNRLISFHRRIPTFNPSASNNRVEQEEGDGVAKMKVKSMDPPTMRRLVHEWLYHL